MLKKLSLVSMTTIFLFFIFSKIFLNEDTFKNVNILITFLQINKTEKEMIGNQDIDIQPTHSLEDGGPQVPVLLYGTSSSPLKLLLKSDEQECLIWENVPKYYH